MNESSQNVAAVKNWYLGLRDGDSQIAQNMWNLYFQRMVVVARRKLDGGKRAAADEEDIAISAFKSFCNGFRQGRFQSAEPDYNLWPLLVSLTINKAIDHMRRENRVKRGRGKLASGLTSADLDQLACNQPTAEMVAATAESFEQLLLALDGTGDYSLRAITLDSISGESTADMAVKLGCTRRTIQRKLQTIRALWEAQNR